jgi:hypothetical protein
MNALRLAWRMLVRDWRAGELAVLGMALVLAVAALTSVSFLADRVQQGLILQSHQLLGGDLLLSADHPWRDEFRSEARRRQLQRERQFHSTMPPRGNATGGHQGDQRHPSCAVPCASRRLNAPDATDSPASASLARRRACPGAGRAASG